MPDSTIKISNGQLFLLLVTVVSSTAVLFIPAIALTAAGRDAWLSILVLATLYGLGVVWVITSLSFRFPGETCGQYFPRIIGKPLALLVELGFQSFLLLVSIIIIKEFGDFLNTAFMQETPIQAFNLSLIVLSAFAAYHGLEVVGRIIQFVFPLLMVTFLAIILLVIPEMEFYNLLPVLAEGFLPVFKGSFTAVAFRGEVFLLLWILPHVNRPEESRLYAFLAVIFLGIILSADTLASLMVFGSDLAGKLTFPTFVFARYIAIGEFLERVEALVMVIWVAGVIVKVSVFFTIIVSSVRGCFGFKGSRWAAVIPVGIILYTGSLYIFQNDPQVIQFMEKTWPPLAVVFQLILPAVLLAIAWLRGVKGGKEGV